MPRHRRRAEDRSLRHGHNRPVTGRMSDRTMRAMFREVVVVGDEDGNDHQAAPFHCPRATRSSASPRDTERIWWSGTSFDSRGRSAMASTAMGSDEAPSGRAGRTFGSIRPRRSGWLRYRLAAPELREDGHPAMMLEDPGPSGPPPKGADPRPYWRKGAIKFPRFDTYCPNCHRRLRVDLPEPPG